MFRFSSSCGICHSLVSPLLPHRAGLSGVPARCLFMASRVCSCFAVVWGCQRCNVSSHHSSCSGGLVQTLLLPPRELSLMAAAVGSLELILSELVGLSQLQKKLLCLLPAQWWAGIQQSSCAMPAAVSVVLTLSCSWHWSGHAHSHSKMTMTRAWNGTVVSLCPGWSAAAFVKGHCAGGKGSSLLLALMWG